MTKLQLVMRGATKSPMTTLNELQWQILGKKIGRKVAVASQCGETSLYPGRSVTVAGKVKGNIGGNLLQSARELSLGV